MKTNIAIAVSAIIVGVCLAAGCNSRESRTTLLPECEIAYNGTGVPFSQIVESTRPKVVVCNNMLAKNISKEALFNDVELLEEFPEFDFIFYLATSSDNVQRVETVARENRIKAVVMIDPAGTFRTLNKLDSRAIVSALIFDSELKPHLSALPGVGFSPFGREAKRFLRKYY